MLRFVQAGMLLVCLWEAGSAHAQGAQRFNPYSNRWEIVQPGSELRYNPYTGQREYAAPGASPLYNQYERRWDLAPPNSQQQRYNPYSNRWEAGAPDAASRPAYGAPGATLAPQYSPYEKRRDMAPQHVQQRYNPLSNSWETTGSDAQTQYGAGRSSGRPTQSGFDPQYNR